jgi:hypothetical protein
MAIRIFFVRVFIYVFSLIMQLKAKWYNTLEPLAVKRLVLVLDLIKTCFLEKGV